MKISIFGSARPLQKDLLYQEAQHLGSLLGSHGFTILTGGYCGTMEAVSKGVAESGGHVIGVTSREIEHWRPGKANPWVQEEWTKNTLLERIADLIHSCDIAVGLPGGVGTLTEIILLWNHILVEIIPAKPIILIGSAWKNIFNLLETELSDMTNSKDFQHLIYANDCDQAYKIILNHQEHLL
ncbi:MAG: LOG family protein [Anaerolineaceae bacterium]|nr:LOG family protein [Anaerolineaceae bacterium]